MGISQFQKNLLNLLEKTNNKMVYDFPYIWEIADKLGTTTQQVTKAFNQLNIKYPKEKIVTHRAYEIAKKYKSGMTVSQLAQANNTTYCVVKNHLEYINNMGIYPQRGFYGKKVKPKPTEIFKPVKVIITDGEHEGEYGIVESITDTWNVKVNGRVLHKEGWQIREIEKHNNLIRKGKI